MAPGCPTHISGLLQEGQRLLVIVTDGVTSEATTADRIGRSDTRQDGVADRCRPRRTVGGEWIELGYLGEGLRLVVPLRCILTVAASGAGGLLSHQLAAGASKSIPSVVSAACRSGALSGRAANPLVV